MSCKAIAHVEALMKSKFGDVEILVGICTFRCTRIYAGYDGYDPEPRIEYEVVEGIIRKNGVMHVFCMGTLTVVFCTDVR